MIRSVHILVAALAVWLAAAGCSSDVVPKAEDLADRACACETVECAEELNSELEAFLRETTGEKLSERDQDRLRAAAARIGGCIAEQLGAEAIPGDDDAAGHSVDPSHDHHDHDHDHDH